MVPLLSPRPFSPTTTYFTFPPFNNNNNTLKNYISDRYGLASSTEH
jgi:hypothetical protein